MEREYKHITSRKNWISAHRTNESKTVESVIDKIPVKELEKAEELGIKSQIGSYIDFTSIGEAHNEDLVKAVENMTEQSILVYYWNGELTIWKKKKGENGLVRIK